MSRLGPTGLTQLLTNIKTWVTTKLGNYVTTDTAQTVTGKKLFTASSIQLDNVTSMFGSTMFIDTSAAAPRGEFPAESHRVGRIYIGDNTSYNGAWFIVDPTIDTNKAYYRMVTTNPDNTDSTRFSITWDGSKTGARCRKNVSQGDLLPSGNNTYNLGADDLKWDIGYIHNLIGTNKENASEDANDYYSTTGGSHMTFYTTSNGGTKLSNVPAAVNTHLESRTIRYLSSSDWIVEQICHNSFGLYYRKGTNGTWEDWKTFAFTNSNITGTAANVTGTVAIANGGTGATTRLNAVKNLTNESVGTPTHFLTITTNYAKAGYTNISQVKTVLGITGDIVSHNASEFLTTSGTADKATKDASGNVITSTYVNLTGDQSISGLKSYSKHINIAGDQLGNEQSVNGNTCLYLTSKRDTVNKSGIYVTKFRQNVAQGSMGASDVMYLSYDVLENEVRTNGVLKQSYGNWSNDVPGTLTLYSEIGTRNLGYSAYPWTSAYVTNLYIDGTQFVPSEVMHLAGSETVTGTKIFNGDKIVITQGNGYRMVCNTDGGSSGYGVFQRVDSANWYLMVTAQDDALGTWTSARPITIRLSDGYCTINGKADEANKVQATIAAGTTAALVQGTIASNDCFRIAAGGATNAGWAEIATGDDANEPIYVRQYKGSFTTLQRTATLLDGSGNTSFPGTVTATGFSGPLTGDVTGTATKATCNANGNEITDTVIKGLSISGKTITYTKIDGNTGTLTTQDTVYTHPTTSGNKHIPSGGSSGQFLGWDSDGTAKWVNNPNTNTDTKVTQTVTTDNSAYPVLLCATANATATGTTTSRFSAGLTVNTRYSSIYITNKYDTANTKGVRNTSSYNNGVLYFRSYDATEMGTIRCESNKGGYQQIYMMASNYIKDGAIDPEGTRTTCYITVRVRDNGSKTIYTDGSWENSLTPYANNTYSLGTSSNKWKAAHAVNFYENGTALSSKYAQIANISTNGIGTTCLLAYFPENTTDLSLVAGETKSGTSLYVVYWWLESTASVSGNMYTNSHATLAVNKGYAETGTWKLLHSMSQGVTQNAMIGVWVRIA